MPAAAQPRGPDPQAEGLAARVQLAATVEREARVAERGAVADSHPRAEVAPGAASPLSADTGDRDRRRGPIRRERRWQRRSRRRRRRRSRRRRRWWWWWRRWWWWWSEHVAAEDVPDRIAVEGIEVRGRGVEGDVAMPREASQASRTRSAARASAGTPDRVLRRRQNGAGRASIARPAVNQGVTRRWASLRCTARPGRSSTGPGRRSAR
jgi:hypothetical protein